MFQFLARRVLWSLPVLLAVLLITFLMMHAAPYGPWDKNPERLALKQHAMDEATRKFLDRQFGLDKPMWRQFMMYVFGDWDKDGRFVCGVVCGNLGPSYRQRGRMVQDVIFQAPEGMSWWTSRLGYSLRLALLALAFTIAVGIPLGVAAALNQGRWIDHLLTFFETLCISIPNFVLGFLIIVIVLMLRIKFIALVPRSWSGWQPWVLPVIILGAGPMAFTARLTRAAMLEVIPQHYVYTARAKGLSERVVISRHMIKNALIPVVTLLGPLLAELIASSFVIEMMFGFPGMGSIYVMAIKDVDYSMVLGATILYAILVVSINLAVDLTYGLLNPRIRVG